MEIVGGSGINPRKTRINISFGSAMLTEFTGFLKMKNTDLTNNIREVHMKKRSLFFVLGIALIGTVLRSPFTALPTILGDIAFGGIGTLAGLAFGGKRKQILVRLKLRDAKEILLTCTDKDYAVLYSIYLNTEKEDQSNVDNKLTLDNLIKLKEDGVISEEEYKEKARELMGL